MVDLLHPRSLEVSQSDQWALGHAATLVKSFVYSRRWRSLSSEASSEMFFSRCDILVCLSVI